MILVRLHQAIPMHLGLFTNVFQNIVHAQFADFFDISE